MASIVLAFASVATSTIGRAIASEQADPAILIDTIGTAGTIIVSVTTHRARALRVVPTGEALLLAITVQLARASNEVPFETNPVATAGGKRQSKYGKAAE